MSATLLDERRVDPGRYAIGSVAPTHAVRPASAEEVAEALRAASRDQLSVIPWGGGVGLALERPPARYDVALDLTALDQIIEYDPEDFTLTAGSGTALDRLRATLGERGQELPIEAPAAERATLGGALAANASGARRLRFGAPRDRILGARYVLSDGTLARAGGKVVKNVAGYGIHRLLCGSRGGLAVLVEASLKVAPAPERRIALVYRAHREEISDRERWAFLPRLEPTAVTVLGADTAARVPGLAAAANGDEFTVIVGLEDDDARVDQQCNRVIERLGLPPTRWEEEEVRALWLSLSDLEHFRAQKLSFATADNSPAALEPVLASPEFRSLVFHAPCGRLHLFPDPSGATPLLDRLAPEGFALIDACGLGDLGLVRPPQTALLALRQSIRSALDPACGFILGDRWLNGST
jgi:FAD/FMN-containing dehydrogenase